MEPTVESNIISTRMTQEVVNREVLSVEEVSSVKDATPEKASQEDAQSTFIHLSDEDKRIIEIILNIIAPKAQAKAKAKTKTLPAQHP